MAKKGNKQEKYSAEFKITVIMDMRENHLGYKETARKYGLVKSSMGGAIYTLHRWERIYLEEGDGRTSRKEKCVQTEEEASGKVCGRRFNRGEPKIKRKDRIS